MHAGPVWQRHLDVTPIFREDFLSSWNTNCGDLFSTCQFPMVWRGWLKEQLKWGKRYFCYHLLNSVLQARVITEKKQWKGGTGEVWRGDRDQGRRGRLLAGHSSSTPTGRRYVKVHHFSVNFFSPKHSVTIERLRRECKWLQYAIALRQWSVWISGVLCEVKNEKRSVLGLLLTNMVGCTVTAVCMSAFSLARIFFYFR